MFGFDIVASVSTMASNNHVPGFSEDWSNDAASWAEVPRDGKPSPPVELAPLHDDSGLLDTEIVTKKSYAEGDTIGW